MHLLCTTLPQDVGRVGIAFADKGGGVLCLKVTVTVSMANAVWGTSSFPGCTLDGQKLSCWVPSSGCMQVVTAIDCFVNILFWYDNIILIMIMKIYEAFVRTLHAVWKKFRAQWFVQFSKSLIHQWNKSAYTYMHNTTHT